ncbi:MAG: hypothetical protein MUQ80_01640, partial [Flavobacteriaceae bacterium]|nr:hypothetical protein [Flavobacteriaceae bacterium]
MSTAQIEKEIAAWQKIPFDAQTQREVAQLATKNPLELEDAFYKNLAFGNLDLTVFAAIANSRRPFDSRSLAMVMKIGVSGKAVTVYFSVFTPDPGISTHFFLERSEY